MLTSSATDAKNTVKEGVVFKKGEGFMSGWKERYLILYNDKRLSYFIIDGLEHKGSIFIHNTAPSNISESNKGNKSEGASYGFYIQTLGRKWEFAVKSFKERDVWIKTIRATIEGKIEQQLKPKSPAFDINQSMSLPIVSKSSNMNNNTNLNNNNNDQKQPEKQPVLHSRNSSKSAFVNPNTQNQYYNHNQYTQQQQQRPKSPMQTQQQQQQYNNNNNNYNYGQQQQYNQQQQQQYNQYNQQYNQQQYNNNQQRTHHGSFAAKNGYNNGYNNYYQQQQQQNGKQNNQPPPAWKTGNHSYNNSGSMNKYSQKPKKVYKPSLKKSVYAGFKTRKYDNSTRFSHLCSGYIRNLSMECPLKLQNLCQEYLGYFWFNNELPFKNSELLNTNELKIKMIQLLCNGMNKYFIKKIDLIYSGNNDELNAKSFHKKCDGHGQTLVLLYTNYGSMCGGYTNIPWSKDNKYHTDKNAFLFSLNSNKTEEKEQLFKIKENEIGRAVLHYKEFGPTWGYGHDLAVFSLSENDLNTQSCNSSYSFLSFHLLGGWMYCKVMKCEVFKIYTS